VKCLGGEVDSHIVSGESYGTLAASRVTCRSSCVKSPVCSADRGRSIARPACNASFSTVDGAVDSLISAGGSNGGEAGVFTLGLRANVLLS
jgi:hypothetical protein